MSFVVPTPKTWVDGEIPDYAELQSEVYDTINFILNPPAVKLRQTVNQSISNGTWTFLSYDGVELDTHGFTSTADKTKITPTVPGWYRGWCGTAFNTSGSFMSGQRDIEARLNNTDSMVMYKNIPPSAFSGSTYVKPSGLSFLVPCNGSTDYLQIRIYQASGGTMTTIANRTDYQPQLFLQWHCRL